jgi:3-oxoacyl-(acyl-carrier-protein) synthase/NAD(P)-dependent dehydrogenase (short-subunit alcohol dehydrogenase family)/acyl carrier protein/phosphopantetheinyl transferase (holo-ACP synthase)
MEIFSAKKISCKLIPVSHAFHTRVVSAASDPLRKVLERSSVKGPKLPILSNVTAELYPKEPGEVADLLARQVASPVEFIAIVEKMYERGARTFVELGPKRALTGFVRDILGRRPHRAVTTNHPKKGGPRTLVEALASLAADGQPIGPTRLWKEGEDRAPLQVGQPVETETVHRQTRRESFAEGGRPRSFAADDGADASVWITGAAVGLPGFDKMFDDGNLERFLDGQNLIKPLERKIRQRIAEQSIVRLVKSEDGTGELVEVESPDQVMAFAGRGGELDLDSDYGVGAEWESDKDSTTKLALAAAFEALRDSWIPLVEQRKSVSNGRSLGMGFRLPEQEASTTGVIFASAFPGYERLLSMVEDLRDGKPFPRSALLQMLSVGHALVAERVGALGPNLQLNTACSSTTTAVGVAQDWIRAGRCDRVLVLGADDVTSEALMPWVGGGFLAVGAATTEEDLSRAAVPFGAGRNGLVLGMGAVGLVVERADRARRRGVTPLMEIVSTRMANSASHPMRLRPKHIAQEVDALVEEVCVAEGLSREEIAGQLVFMSHETYTPARGGSAEAEANALREAFGPHAGEVLVVNTKGYTGHPMAAGIEEGILAAGLWANKLPGVANLDSPDPAFQDLTFHRGGPIERKYALRLAAGFGSQIGLAFFKRGDGQGDRLDRSAYRSYLAELTGTDRPEVVMDRRVLRARSAHRAGDSELPDALEATPAVLPDTEPSPRPTEEAEPAVAGKQTASAAPPRRVTTEAVLCRLQEVVSEKTGYDVEELEGDLELEADLGVDTVKQAEIMATVRESYGLERDESFRLSDYPTLDDMARYVMERMGSTRPTAENQAEVESAVPVPEGAEPGERPGEEGETAETAGTVAAEEVLCLLQEVVSEKTGYDVDELEGDLELEADLGVDTVKQAEIMATVRESYGLERDESFRLSDYPTLDDMARYVMERMGSGRPTPDPESGPEGDGWDGRVDFDADGAAPWTRGERPWDLGDGFSIQRLSYRPQPIERGGDDSSPFFEGEAGRVDGAVLLVSRERSGPLGLELARETFGSKAKVARLPSEKLAGADRQELAQKLEVLFEQQGASRLHSVVWVQEERATVEEQASALDALRLAQAIGDVFEGSPPVSSWVTVALEAGKSVGMESRGCLGFSRCLSHEWPGCRVETVSVDPKGASLEKGQGWGRVGREIGGLLGRSPTGRHVRLTPEGMAVGEPAPFTELEPRSLPPDAVVLVTGAMGGVGSIAVRALCEAWGCRFVLTGRREEIATPAPELVSRKEMRERLRRQGRRPTPVAIDREMSRLARDRSASELVEELTSRGVSFFYHPADLTDERDVDALVEECKKRWGRLDVVVHAAGLEWSRALGQKTAEEMETVWEAKAGAAVRLCESCRRVFGSLPERFVSFGSVAGVFGNGGQCDYAAANAALAGLSALYPSETEFLTVHWTGWDNVGMTESPRIREALLQRNVQLLPPDLGEVAIARLVASAAQGEVVVCGELGALAEAGPAISPASARRAEDDRASARASMSGGEPYLLEVDQHSGGATLIWEIDSSIDWLRDHAIESVCVLPGVVGLELMARAAERLLPEGQRDVSVEDVRFLRPVKVFEGGPTVVRVRAARGEGGEVSVALDSVRETRRGPLEQSHFEARIVGRQEDAEGGNGRPFALRRLDRQGPEKKEIYECFFHGPRFQVLESVRLVGADGLVATGRVGPLDLTGGDAGRPNRVNPLLVEAVFQAAGFHALMEDGTLALPTGIGRMEMSSVTRSFGAEGEGASRDVVIRVRRTGGDPKGARPRRFRFDGEVMTPAGRRICRLYGCEMSGLDSVKPPEGRRAFEVVEIPLASLGDEDRLLVDLENELAPGEMRQASKIAHSRRRLEWIAGRLAAKELVRLHLRDRHGIGVGRSDVEIASEPGGAPVALLPGRPSLSGLLPALSITHAAGRALVMGVPSFEPEARLGLDLVPIEPRGPAFEKEWLTESEGRLIAGSSSPERDRRVSSIWALKEAVSKALGLGLHLTTAELEVMSIDPNGLAVMRLAGKARLRYGSLGARGLTCGVQMRADTVIAWARLDLTEETLDRPEPHPSPAWCRTLTLPM